MGEILQFIRPYDVFDPETLVILGEAYDKSLASLHDRGNHSLCARSWLSASSTLRQWVSVIQIAYVKLHSAPLARHRHSIA